MKKIKSLLKGSPLAMIVVGVLVAGVASAALLAVYGHTTGNATNVQQSVVFSDDGNTEKTYEVGNSDPVAGNIYYDLVVLKNNSSNKAAPVSLSTEYWYGGHHGFTATPEPGITTSYMKWNTPQFALTGTRPTVVYNPYEGTGYQNYKKYEMWYKTSATNLHYAYYHPNSSWDYTWDGTDTDISKKYDAPFVMKEDGKYYMVNNGYTDDSTSKNKFDIYTSDDGITWTKSSSPIYTETRTDIEKIDNPMVIKDETGYKMYFQGRLNGNPYPDGKYYIFEATSNATNLKDIADGTKGFTAANSGKSILQPGVSRSWDEWRIMQPWVTKIGNKGYLMMYTGYDRRGNDNGAIGYAVSSDGIKDWKKISVSKEGYDMTIGKDAYQPTLVKTDNNLRLFYEDYGKGKIYWTSLAPLSNPMTIYQQEIKPFFIKNDFMINLAPGDYKIKTSINPTD